MVTAPSLLCIHIDLYIVRERTKKKIVEGEERKEKAEREKEQESCWYWFMAGVALFGVTVCISF